MQSRLDLAQTGTKKMSASETLVVRRAEVFTRSSIIQGKLYRPEFHCLMPCTHDRGRSAICAVARRAIVVTIVAEHAGQVVYENASGHRRAFGGHAAQLGWRRPTAL